MIQACALKSRLWIAALAASAWCLPGHAGIEVYTGTDEPASAVVEPEPPERRPEPQFDSGSSDRLALVISMQDYDFPTYDVLETPTEDGDGLAAAFRKLGYRVMRVRDADRAGLDAALGTFAEAVTPKSTVAVFYTGIGVALPAERDNRLLPADLDANLPQDETALRQAVAQGSFALSADVLARIKRRRPKALIVFYDGCHPGPAKALGGSSCKPVKIRNAATLYAAGPGAPSLETLGADDNSPLSVFARAIVQGFEAEPSLRIAIMFRVITERVQSMTEETGVRQSPVARLSLKPELRDGGLCIAPKDGACTARDLSAVPDEVPAEPRGELPTGAIDIEPTPYTPFSGSGDASLDREAVFRACDTFAANPGHIDNPEGVSGVAFTDIDVAKALPACLKAVEVAPDNLRMRYQLARAKQAAEQHKDAITDFRTLAEDHDYAAAMNNLGSSYQLGLGVEVDDAEAVRWYKMAAERGFVPSMAVLGWMYQTGKGIGKDYDAAFGWYKKAADAGFAPAMNNLGFMYQNGWGTRADLKTAASWFLEAAEAGLPQAMSMMGWLYEQGQGVEKDIVESLKWYAEAADRDVPSAMGAIGGIYDRGGPGVERSPEKAADWFLAAIGRKHALTRERLVEQPDTLHADTRQAIQAALAKHGYDPGPADGVFGERTRQAIEKLFSGE